MFYLIQFDNDKSEETQNLKYELSGYPNGTILSHSHRITKNDLSSDKWIVWINKDNVKNYNEQYENFLKIKNIKSFIELVDINVYPDDDNWLWDDNYINNLFSKYIL